MKGLDPKFQLGIAQTQATLLRNLARALPLNNPLRSQGLLCAHLIEKLLEELQEARELSGYHRTGSYAPKVQPCN